MKQAEVILQNKVMFTTKTLANKNFDDKTTKNYQIFESFIKFIISLSLSFNIYIIFDKLCCLKKIIIKSYQQLNLSTFESFLLNLSFIYTLC